MSFDSSMDTITIAVASAVLLYYIFCAGIFYRVFSRKKFILWAAFRFAALACLLLALAGARLIIPSRITATIFLVDRSLSASQNQSEVEEYINRQLNNKKARDRVAVVSFAKEPMIEMAFTGEPRQIKLQTAPDPETTNLEKALEFCRDYFPSNVNKRLVVFTDGKENIGSAARVWKSMEQSGINAVLYRLNPSQDGDVQLTSIELPENLHPGEKAPLKITLDSNMETEGYFYLYRDDDLIMQQPLRVQKGTSVYEFEVDLGEKKVPSFKGEIHFQEDTCPQNNTFTLVPSIKGMPSVLVVGEEKNVKNVEHLLDSLGLEHKTYAPGRVPDTLTFLSSFSEIILADVPHDRLSENFEKNLELCVREKGTGLIVVGGENSFAPGGYKDTLLEKMLPVSCTPKGKKRQPDTGLVLVLDCSGSMDEESAGARKIDLVKQAAVKAAQVLESQDEMGVIGFSDVVEWVVPFGPVGDKEKVRQEMESLAPKGGTLILPAVEKAVEALEDADVKVRHIILLSDGQAEKSGYESILERLKRANITLSTVAVGKDADASMLRALAQQGGGRSYVAENLYEIPQLFTKETYLGTKKYLNNDRFIPEKADSGELFKNERLPALYGYTATGIKQKAELVLKSDSDDPVLAQWFYGLGKVAVWTSDLSGQWSRDWIMWEGFQREWGRLVNSCLALKEEDGMDVSITRKGCDAQVYVATNINDPGQSVEASLQSSEGFMKKIPLVQIRPGQFEGNIAMEKPAEYLLAASLIKDGKVLKKASRIIHLDYSPEYSIGAEGSQAAYLLAKGGIANKDTDVFRLPLQKKNWSQSPLDYILLPLALLFFTMDIWTRKFLQ